MRMRARSGYGQQHLELLMLVTFWSLAIQVPAGSMISCHTNSQWIFTLMLQKILAHLLRTLPILWALRLSATFAVLLLHRTHLSLLTEADYSLFV